MNKEDLEVTGQATAVIEPEVTVENEPKERTKEDVLRDIEELEAGAEAELDASVAAEIEKDQAKKPEKPAEVVTAEPAVASTEPEPTEPATQVDEDALPEDRERANHAFKEQRLKLKQEKEARETVEQELAALKQGAVTQPEVAAQPAAQQKRSLQELAQIYVQARNDEIPEGGGMSAPDRNRAVEREAFQELTQSYSPRELAVVAAQASRGQLGPDSQQVAEALALAMPLAQANADMPPPVEPPSQKEVEAQYRSEMQAVVNDYPHFAKEGSDEAKFYGEFQRDYLGQLSREGTIVAPGKLPQEAAIYLYSHPRLQAMMADMAMKASKAESVTSEVEKLKQDNLNLRRQLDSGRQIDAGDDGAPLGAGSSQRTAADIKAEIRALPG